MHTELDNIIYQPTKNLTDMKKVYKFINEFAEQNGIEVCVFRSGLLGMKVSHATIRVPNEEMAHKLISALTEKFDIPKGFLFYEKWEDSRDNVYHEVSVFKKFFTYKVNNFLSDFKSLANLKGYETREVIGEDCENNCPFIIMYSATVPTIADIQDLCDKYRIPQSNIEYQCSWGYLAVYLNYPDF